MSNVLFIAVPEQKRLKLAPNTLGLACGLVLVLMSASARAAWVNINLPQDSQLKLLVALETSPRGVLPTPAVTIGVPAAQVGTGMVTGAPNVQIEMGLRSARTSKKPPTSTTATGTLLVQARNCAPEIPIADFGWLSTPIPGAPAGTALISSQGSLAGAAVGPMAVASITSLDSAEAWVGALLTFTLANTMIYPAGTFTCTFEFTAALQ